MVKKRAIKRSYPSSEKTRHSPDMPLREVILKFACNSMNEKGFRNASIGEIAKLAGVKDPVIYQYFNGKEGLLLSIVQSHMEKGFAFIDEQLQGISGARDKLRKFFWAHLRNNDVARESIALILLECRSDPKFYKTDAYQMIRSYAGILTGILKEGIEEKTFRPDVNLRLIRDLIFGLADLQAITCLVTKEIPEATPDHGDCMNLIERILLKKPKDGFSGYSKRERILSSAIKVFSSTGYNEGTISEIAAMAGVASGTVYEYFKNKEELLLAIPEERLKVHLSEIKKGFKLREPIRKLRHFIQYHFSLYLNDRDFLRVWVHLILLNRRFYQSRAYESLRQYVGVLEELVQGGIDDGSFAPDTNVRVYRNLFLGTFAHMVLRWLFLSQDVELDKIREIYEVTNFLTDALTDGNISS